MEWKRKDEEDQSDKLFGCSVLRTDRKDLSAEKIWKLYITLTRAESGFRSLKSSLGLRPNFHQKEDRVDGHVLITVLAHHLLRQINYILEGSTDTRQVVTELDRSENLINLGHFYCYLRRILYIFDENNHKNGQILQYLQPIFSSVTACRSWDTLKRVLQTHCYTTMRVPRTHGKTYRIRKAGEPEEVHKNIYAKLGVDWNGLPSKKIELGTVEKNDTTL